MYLFVSKAGDINNGSIGDIELCAGVVHEDEGLEQFEDFTVGTNRIGLVVPDRGLSLLPLDVVRPGTYNTITVRCMNAAMHLQRFKSNDYFGELIAVSQPKEKQDGSKVSGKSGTGSAPAE